MDDKDAVELSSRYTRFADEEVRGKSPLYGTLARGVASDPQVIDVLLTLPPEMRQPNLLLAAVRHLFGTPADWIAFRQTILTEWDAVRSLTLTRSTQTNEPGRCATLLPVLAALPQPLALIEVGASAGLCLLPDFYSYKYGHRLICPKAPTSETPLLACSANETTPLPPMLPEVTWRAGLDINPLDVSDPSQAAWLENLVWPEQTERLDRLRAAMKIRASIRSRIVKGSLLGDDLPRLCAEAPEEATLVIFHTAVLAYISDRTQREAFAARVLSLCQFWVSNESPHVFPEIASRATTSRRNSFLMSVNGSPVAWTDPHGASIDWIA